MARVSAILTAAGESTRMGRPKPLLPWRGVSLVEHQVACLLEGGCDEVVVVLGHAADEVAPLVRGEGVRAVVNPDYRQGKTISIKTGLAHADPSATAIVLLAVDQPRTAAIVREVVRAHLTSGALVTSPRYEGHGGHPLVFAAGLRPELARISEERQGIREVIQAHRGDVQEMPLDDPMIRLDLNTPQAYESAYTLWGTIDSD